MQKRQELRPGQKFTFNLSPQEIFEHTSINDVVCAVVTDDIDRNYESDSEELQSILKGIVD